MTYANEAVEILKGELGGTLDIHALAERIAEKRNKRARTVENCLYSSARFINCRFFIVKGEVTLIGIAMKEPTP